MKKKIDLFWYWFIFVVAFVFCFFCVQNKNVDAYTLDSNGNVVSDNLVDFSKIIYNSHNSSFTIDNNETITIDIKPLDLNDTNRISGGIFFNIPNLEDRNYHFSFSVKSNSNGKLSYGVENSNLQDVPILTEYERHDIIINPTKGNFIMYVYYWDNTNVTNIYVTDLMISYDYLDSYEPFGSWYSSTNAENMFLGRLPSFTSSLTYEDDGTGSTLSINDLNAYIDNSFGYLYFNRVWSYLDNLAIDGYSNARLTINFNENLNINTSYIINSNGQNYGSGVWFYQNNDLMLDVRNFYDNEYCGGASQYSCNVELNKYVNVGNGINSFSYLNKIVVWSATTDERTLAFGYNNIGYNTGYDNGYSVGYKDGKSVSDNLVYNNGYTNGYNVGYDKGVNYASNGGNTLVGLVGAIFTSPVNMLQTIFDFEFLGINLTNFLFSLISLFIVIWLIRKFL